MSPISWKAEAPMSCESPTASSMSERSDELRLTRSVDRYDEVVQQVAKQHDDALHKFEYLRSALRRTAAPCGRPFVLANRVTEELSKGRSADQGSGLYNLMWTEHTKRSDAPALLRTAELETMSCIFYILLDMKRPNLINHFHQLNDTNLPLSKADLEQKIGRDVLEETLGIAEVDSFYNDFCEKQIEWSPLVFDWRMHAVVTDQIIPYYHMSRIEPNIGHRNTPNDRAKLYEIHVPEELVGATLREKLKSVNLLRAHQTDMETADEVGRECRYYRFALKEFSKDMKDDFERERAAFDALRDQNGMIQYYGWYELKGGREHTYNIVLEYADFDLHSAFKKESPPISPREIKGFWEQMLGLATTLHNIHQLDVEGHKYDFWHGDVKPENILRVQNRFKLADPGDGRIRLATQGVDQPRARVYGGTLTYASPEKAQYFWGKTKDANSILQNSDLWSLACVFSMAATYVVLGTQGVILYDRVRKHGHVQSKTELISDDFHDGNDVLPVVKTWHSYLRSSIRLTDAYTERILTMIDDHLLVMPPETRWDAKKVSEYLDDLIKSSPINALDVPSSIEDILQQIDLEAEVTIESSVNIDRVDSDMVKKQIQDKRRLKEGFDEAVQSRSGAELFNNTQILPTAQRTEHREELLQKYHRIARAAGTGLPQLVTLPFQRMYESGNPIIPAIASGEFSLVENPEAMSTDLDPAHSLPEHPVTMWEMEDELKSKATSSTLPSLKSLRNRQLQFKKPVSAKGRLENDLLENHYTERDIVYLVDNGSSMARHWSHATYLMRILIWRSLGYDDNGMELFFTDPNTRICVSPSPQQDVGQFVSAMNRARPDAEGRGTEHAKTDIWPRLQEIVMKYHNERIARAKERKKTIIILTDGVWAGMKGDSDLDYDIQHLFSKLAGLHRIDRTTRASNQGSSQEETDPEILERIRPITIQFIAFGHNKIALERMQRLDDELGDGWPDLIDMEPENGCVYKMFLGSLVPGWDRRVNRANSMVPMTPASPTLDVSSLRDNGSFGNRSRANSALSQLASPRTITSPSPDVTPVSASGKRSSASRFSWGGSSPSSSQQHQSSLSTGSNLTKLDLSR